MIKVRKAYHVKQLDMYERCLEGKIPGQEKISDQERMMERARRFVTRRETDLNRFRFVEDCIRWGSERGLPVGDLYKPITEICYHEDNYFQDYQRRGFRRPHYSCCDDLLPHEDIHNEYVE